MFENKVFHIICLQYVVVTNILTKSQVIIAINLKKLTQSQDKAVITHLPLKAVTDFIGSLDADTNDSFLTTPKPVKEKTPQKNLYQTKFKAQVALTQIFFKRQVNIQTKTLINFDLNIYLLNISTQINKQEENFCVKLFEIWYFSNSSIILHNLCEESLKCTCRLKRSCLTPGRFVLSIVVCWRFHFSPWTPSLHSDPMQKTFSTILFVEFVLSNFNSSTKLHQSNSFGAKLYSCQYT